MTNTQKTILISGARAPIALEMARSFSQAGHRVIMTDCLHFTITRWSNTVSKYYFIPSPRFKKTEFVKKLQEIIELEKVDHFIPTCEEAIFISHYISSFNCKVWTVEHHLILELHNKFIFTQLHQNNFPIPKTTLVSNFTDWSNSSQYVFKPIFSRFASSILIKQKLNKTYFSETEKHLWIAQEHIEGKEICVYSVWDEGILKAYAAYHPFYRAGKGAGIFFEPIENQLIFDYVQKTGSKIKYTGHLCFDVIIDKNKIPYFIECNPRGTSGAHLINKNLAEAFLGKNTFINNSNKEFSLKYILFFLSFKSFFTNRVLQSKDIVFQWSDLKPFLFQIISLLEIAYIKITQRVSLLQATTFNIEWNENNN